jgi:hypothetical protein
LARRSGSLTIGITVPAPGLVTEKVDRSELPDDVSWTWILTRRDRSLSQRQQHRSIAAVRGTALASSARQIDGENVEIRCQPVYFVDCEVRAVGGVSTAVDEHQRWHRHDHSLARNTAS